MVVDRHSTIVVQLSASGVISCLSIFLVGGCITTSIINPETLEERSSKDIIVTTIDDREIAFDAEDYTVIPVDSQRTIRGNGIQRLKGKQAERTSFHGDIPFNSIAFIETREKTAFYYTGAVLLVVFVGIYFLLHGNIRQ